MTGSGAHSGSGVGGAIRKGVGLVHGTGEAIRGNFNAAVDSATGNHEAAARNQNIASRGVDEMEHGHYHGTRAGVTPVDTERERMNRVAQGEYGPTESTKYAPHGTNVGNKVDPRYESNVNQHGTMQGSSGYGPHGTDTANQLDPRIDSHRDYRGVQFDGSRSANHAPHSANYEPHHSNIANKFDSTLDIGPDPYNAAHNSYQAPSYGRQATTANTQYGSDLSTIPGSHGDIRTEGFEIAARGMMHDSQREHAAGAENVNGHHQHNDYDSAPRNSEDAHICRADTVIAPQRRDSMPQLQHHPSEQLNQYDRRASRSQHMPHSSRVMNVLDPRVDNGAPVREPHSTENPHSSSFLNLLDPRVDRNAVKKHSSKESTD